MHPTNPISKTDIPNLPIEYQQTLNCEQFLFDSGMGDINRILIFTTNDAMYFYQYQKNGSAKLRSKYV